KISAVQAEQMIEEYAEPKKVESPTPPPIDSEGDNPIWIDTSQEPYIPYVADIENNEWIRMTLSDEDVLVNDVNYNGLKWSKDEGLIVERSDGKVRSILSGTDGIKVQQKIGSEWVDVYYVDENGNVKFSGHLEGATGEFSGEVIGGSIKSNTIIDVTTDLKIGDHIKIGEPGVNQEKYIDFNLEQGTLSRIRGITDENGFTYLDLVNENIIRLLDASGIYTNIHTFSVPVGFNFVTPDDRIDGFLEVNENTVDTIVEQGSNANGEYIRYSNGIQICFLSVFTSTTSSSGGLAANWTYPAAFISPPFTYATVNSSNYINYGVTVQRPTNSQATFRG